MEQKWNCVDDDEEEDEEANDETWEEIENTSVPIPFSSRGMVLKTRIMCKVGK